MSDAHALTIGQLARAAGVPTSSVRYYERRGLLVPDARTGSGYRQYSAASLERLRFIRAAKAAGFTLANIEALLEAAEGAGDAARNEVQQLIQARLADVTERIETLQKARTTLTRWFDTCRERSCSGGCAVLEGLADQET
ncbi:MAG: MerR family transcriptional regulator [Planctomycetota bacterium]|nr:MerR family transcriptional regulator [Planctomycetota bacterium]